MTQFLERIDQLIQSKHLLKHSFYLAWSRGELSRECLQEYSKDYYQHVKAFPTYLSAVHSRTDDASTRRILLQNLVEEEMGSPNHPELWKKFSLALGVTEAELNDHKPSVEVKELINTFKDICGQDSLPAAIASLYAYESQIPEICVSKIDGLKQHYKMTNPADWAYFSVHIDADKEHAQQERFLIARHYSKENRENILSVVQRVLDALWSLLTGLCHRHQICCC